MGTSPEVMPGAQSNLAIPLGVNLLFVNKGKEAHVWDVDGNGYISYGM